MEITDNESLFSDTLQDSKNSEIIERSKCISHFFPFGQQFIQNLSICGRSIVQQDNCPWVDPCEKLIEGFLSGWLFILDTSLRRQDSRRRFYTPVPLPWTDLLYCKFPEAAGRISSWILRSFLYTDFPRPPAVSSKSFRRNPGHIRVREV